MKAISSVRGYEKNSKLSGKDIRELHKKSLLVDLENKYNLSYTQKNALKALMDKRFIDSSDDYIEEWAQRISDGKAYARADANTARILDKADLLEWVVVGYRADGSIYDNYGSFVGRNIAVKRAQELRDYSNKVGDGHKYATVDAYKHWFIDKGLV